MLTASLEKAFAEVSKFGEDEQNTLATWIFQEIDSERNFEKAFPDFPREVVQLVAKIQWNISLMLCNHLKMVL